MLRHDDYTFDIDRGSVSLEATYETCTLLDISLGNSSVTIDGPSATAALSLTTSRATVGAEIVKALKLFPR